MDNKPFKIFVNNKSVQHGQSTEQVIDYVAKRIDETYELIQKSIYERVGIDKELILKMVGLERDNTYLLNTVINVINSKDIIRDKKSEQAFYSIYASLPKHIKEKLKFEQGSVKPKETKD